MQEEQKKTLQPSASETASWYSSTSISPLERNHDGTKPLSPRGGPPPPRLGGEGGYCTPARRNTIARDCYAFCGGYHILSQNHYGPQLLMHLNGTPVLDMRTGYQKTTDLAKMPIEIIISTGRYAC